jgi:hypothetical protein
MSMPVLSKELNRIRTGLQKNAAGYRPVVDVVISVDEP